MDSIGHTACRLVTTALALVTVLGALSAQAEKFSVTTLQNLPDSVSVQGVAINNSGQVAHIYVLSLIDSRECDVVTEDGAVPENQATGAEATAR
jgi:hypothetical protein